MFFGLILSWNTDHCELSSKFFPLKLYMLCCFFFLVGEKKSVSGQQKHWKFKIVRMANWILKWKERERCVQMTVEIHIHFIFNIHIINKYEYWIWINMNMNIHFILIINSYSYTFLNLSTGKEKKIYIYISSLSHYYLMEKASHQNHTAGVHW